MGERSGTATGVLLDLTERERRVIHVLAAGATNREIANRLGLRNRLELAVHLSRIASPCRRRADPEHLT